MGIHSTQGPLRLAWLAGIAAGLAWILHFFTGPEVVNPPVPFRFGDAYAAEIPRIELSQPGGEAWVAAIAIERGRPFLDRTLIGLNGVADRINGLRRRAAEGLDPLDAEAAQRVGALFDAELADLDRYAAEFEAEGVRALDARLPVVLDLGESGLQLQMGGWRTSELNLPERTDFTVRAEVERLHEALNVAYYRLVAQYREVKRQRARF